MPARRVLVPALVLVAAAALLLWRGRTPGPAYDVPGDVAACAARLRTLYAALVEYARAEGHAPRESGVAFLGALVAAGRITDTEALTCPGPFAEEVRAGVDYRLLERLGGADSAYAARDNSAFPLGKFPAGGSEREPLVACDNAAGLNHAGCMNVLYSDGSVVTLSLAQEIERGQLPAGAETIPVGGGSPLADLRKLSRD